jgi:hypothetical protein
MDDDIVAIGQIAVPVVEIGNPELRVAEFDFPSEAPAMRDVLRQQIDAMKGA